MHNEIEHRAVELRAESGGVITGVLIPTTRGERDRWSIHGDLEGRIYRRDRRDQGERAALSRSGLGREQTGRRSELREHHDRAKGADCPAGHAGRQGHGSTRVSRRLVGIERRVQGDEGRMGRNATHDSERGASRCWHCGHPGRMTGPWWSLRRAGRLLSIEGPHWSHCSRAHYRHWTHPNGRRGSPPPAPESTLRRWPGYFEVKSTCPLGKGLSGSLRLWTSPSTADRCRYRGRRIEGPV